MFRVFTKGYSQTFHRWTDALEYANELKPQCRGLFQDIRITECDQVVWVYSKLNKYPMYIGPGTYDRLARLFILENTTEKEQ
jgi:hypothetical protein